MAADPRPPFVAAAHWFVTLVQQVPDTAWDRPGLGEWDVRALVGHTSRSLLTVETYLDLPAEQIVVATPCAYYLAASALAAASPEAVVERGRIAGAALGDHPAHAIAEIADRVLALIPAADDPVIQTIVGGMRFSAYLPTRTFELVVHGYDIAAAIGDPPPPLHADSLSDAVELAGQIAVAAGTGPSVLRALTGRAPLPAGFTVV